MMSSQTRLIAAFSCVAAWFCLATGTRRLQGSASSVSLPVSYYPSTTYLNGFALTQGNLVGTVALPTAYALSFDLKPTSDGAGFRSILRLTSFPNTNSGLAGDKLPGVFFCDGSSCPTLGVYVEYEGAPKGILVTAQALPLNSWSLLTINIDVVNAVLTRSVSGSLSIASQSVIISPSQSTWPSVQIYASSLAYSVAAASIRNLAISSSPPSSPAALPVSYDSFTSYPSGIALTRANLVGIVALPSAYTMSFDLMPTADGTGYRSILRLMGANSDLAGNRIPSVGFCQAGAICPTLGLGVEYEGTSRLSLQTFQALPLNAWSAVTITIDTANAVMTMGVSGAITIAAQSKVITPSQSTWDTAQIYASDPFWSAGAASIRNLIIYPPTSPPSPAPTAFPSVRPSPIPSAGPTVAATKAPTAAMTAAPTALPSSSLPSAPPSPVPSASPSMQPSPPPSAGPTTSPSPKPSAPPSAAPTTALPSRQPTIVPTVIPSPLPSALPSSVPTAGPTAPPSPLPSALPSRQPTIVPTVVPSPLPSALPSPAPSRRPTLSPTGQPTAQPSQPTSRPSGQPSKQPSRQPVGAPSARPTSPPTILCRSGHYVNQTSTGSSLNACQRCAKGRYSTGINSFSCDLCKPGSYAALTGQSSCSLTVAGTFTPIVGAYAPDSCSPGSFNDATSATGCQLCQPGSFAGRSGSRKCEPCAIAFYSSGQGASACQACPGGRSTPLTGSTSESQCLSPENNFILGGIALGIAAIISIVYLVLDGYHFAAFIRRERVVVGQVEKYRAFIGKVLARQRSEKEWWGSEDKWVTKMRERIAKMMEAQYKHGGCCFLKDMKGGASDNEVSVCSYNFLKEVAKTLLFIPLAILTIIFIGACIFLVLLAQVFFRALIVWKQSQNFLAVRDYEEMLRHVVSLLFTVLSGVPPFILDVLKFLVSVLLKLFDLLSLIRIDLSAVGVTCVGAGAPFQLLLNLFVLGVVVVIIGSETQVFRGLCFNQAMERYALRLLSREYRDSIRSYTPQDVTLPKTRSERCLLGCRIVGWWCWYFATLAGFGAIQGVFFLLSFTSLLQFALTLVQIKPFTADNGLHAFSETCNHSPKWENFDTYLAYGSSFVAYALILPVAYEMSKILCPQWSEEVPKKFQIELTADEICESSSSSNSLSAKTGGEPAIVSSLSMPVQDSEEDKTCSAKEERSIVSLLSSLNATAWMRLPVTLVSPDLLMALLMWMLEAALRLRLEGSTAENSGNMEKSLLKVAADACCRLLKIFFEMVVEILQPLRAGSSEEIKWNNEKKKVLMPSYYGLIQEELYHCLGGKSSFKEYFKPHEYRDRDSKASGYPLPAHLLCVILVICPVGHVLTEYGRWSCFIVLKRYYTFVCVSLGIWTESSYTAYDIETKTLKFNGKEADVALAGPGPAPETSSKLEKGQSHTEAPKPAQDCADNETSLKFSACLRDTVATRAVLLQLVPQLTIWSIFTIATAASPVFVFNSSLNNKLARRIIFDCFPQAWQIEKDQYEALKPRGWIVALSGISIFLLESRAISFVFNAYLVFLSVYIVFNPPTRPLIASAVFILLPIAIAYALKIVVLLGRALNIKDIWDFTADKSITTNKTIKTLISEGLKAKAILSRLQEERQEERRKAQKQVEEGQGIDSIARHVAQPTLFQTMLGCAGRVFSLKTGTTNSVRKSSAGQGQGQGQDIGEPTEDRDSIPSPRPSIFQRLIRSSAAGGLGLNAAILTVRAESEHEYGDGASSFIQYHPGATEFMPANMPTHHHHHHHHHHSSTTTTTRLSHFDDASSPHQQPQSRSQRQQQQQQQQQQQPRRGSNIVVPAGAVLSPLQNPTAVARSFDNYGSPFPLPGMAGAGAGAGAGNTGAQSRKLSPRAAPTSQRASPKSGPEPPSPSPPHSPSSPSTSPSDSQRRRL